MRQLISNFADFQRKNNVFMQNDRGFKKYKPQKSS